MNFLNGDRFTIAGVYATVPNPDRKWWQFWKPKEVVSDELKVFEVVAGPTDCSITLGY